MERQADIGKVFVTPIVDGLSLHRICLLRTDVVVCMSSRIEGMANLQHEVYPLPAGCPKVYLEKLCGFPGRLSVYDNDLRYALLFSRPSLPGAFLARGIVEWLLVRLVVSILLSILVQRE